MTLLFAPKSTSLLLLLTTLLLLTPPILSSTDEFEQASDDELTSPPTSTTNCVLRVGDDDLLCEYAIFSTFPKTPLSSSIVLKNDSNGENHGCEPLPPNSLEGKAALFIRGVCPFTSKVFNAQNAGAVAVVIGDNDEYGTVVRMKGTGMEEFVVSINVVMVSEGSYDLIIDHIEDNGDDDVSVYLELEQFQGNHTMTNEYELKENVAANVIPLPHDLMQLGSYFIRNQWIETGRPLILAAAKSSLIKSPEDYELIYSAGEFYHNLLQNVTVSQAFFERAALMIVQGLSTRGKMTKKWKNDAFIRLKSIMILAPERKEQGVAVEMLIKYEEWSRLRFLLVYLYDKKALGTSAVLSWCYNVKNIGEGATIERLVEGPWYRNHQLKESEEWRSAIKAGLEFVREVELEKSKMGGGGGGKREL